MGTDKLALWRSDAWQNVITGLGILRRDKRLGASARYQRLSEVEVEEMYASDDMAAKIVDLPADEMVREWMCIKTKDDNNEVSDLFNNHADEKFLRKKFHEALKLGRLHGGAAIVLGIDDGLEPDKPVNLAGIRSIKYAHVFTRWELSRGPIDRDPESENFGMPVAYRLQPKSSGLDNMPMVHHSRVLRFDGTFLPKRLFISNDYWHDSILNKTHNALRNFHGSHDGVAHIMQDFAQAVFKMKGLSDICASGRDDLLQKRLAMVDGMRAVTRAIILDDEEEFERKMTSLQGIKDVLNSINSRLVQATDGIPHTLLLGESPSGLGATGESEKRDWYDSVAAKQEAVLKSPLETYIKYWMLSKEGPLKGREPESWSIEFKPLWQQEEKEMVANRKAQADTDKIYWEMGALTADEVRESRFSGESFSFETKTNGEGSLPPATQTNIDALVGMGMMIPDDEQHSHRDINGKLLGPAFRGSEPGTHFHFGPEGIYTMSSDGPAHTHRSKETGMEVEAPIKMKFEPVDEE